MATTWVEFTGAQIGPIDEKTIVGAHHSNVDLGHMVRWKHMMASINGGTKKNN